jgi:hypothetical protein
MTPVPLAAPLGAGRAGSQPARFIYAVVAKLANAPGLDSGGFSPCRFESGLPHTALTTKVSALESLRETGETFFRETLCAERHV